MLYLPVIANTGDDGRSPRTLPSLRTCMHRCNEDGIDLETDRQIPRHSKPLAGDPFGYASPRSDRTGSRRKHDKDSAIDLGESRSTQRYNGVPGISLSQGGRWLDSRAFRHACKSIGVAANESQSGNSPSGISAGGSRRHVSDGERFVLKRLKEKLMHRYGSLRAAARDLESNSMGQLTMEVFVERISKILAAKEAQIVYRMLAAEHNDSVSFNNMIETLEGL
eukprot:TRINITY_DN48223_c0_g1_i1.p1 TRINITY_DN48223_c0_g1~~TRINITY_DN48223_c0_g1_i1.p1  ORF type:complete len:223 (-),score=24.03 TRINITY_DN48223_c0_g1_i1:106-774(-)